MNVSGGDNNQEEESDSESDEYKSDEDDDEEVKQRISFGCLLRLQTESCYNSG